MVLFVRSVLVSEASDSFLVAGVDVHRDLEFSKFELAGALP